MEGGTGMSVSLRGSEQSGNWDYFSPLTIQDHGREGGGQEMSQREHFPSTSHKGNLRIPCSQLPRTLECCDGAQRTGQTNE